MKRYLYLELETDAPIMVFAKRRPSRLTIPIRGTWIVKEWFKGKWNMPCCPEITWGTLMTLKFVGKV